MSNILKVFIVLNFVLSVVFVATAATLLGKADNWKGKYVALDEQKTKEISELNTKVNALTGQLGEEKGARQVAVEEKTQQEVANTSLSERLTEEKRSNEKLNNSVEELKEQIKTLTAALKQAQTDREAYEKRMSTAEESARTAMGAKETAEDDGRRKDAEITDLKEQLAQHERDLVAMKSDLDHQKNLVAIAMEKGINFDQLIKAPPIDAVVQKVNAELNFVMLSVGGDDKVTKGISFTVSRGGSYVGEVEVDYVYPKTCAAKILRVKPGMAITTGDAATTRY